jgi:hypothetical protein
MPTYDSGYSENVKPIAKMIYMRLPGLFAHEAEDGFPVTLATPAAFGRQTSDRTVWIAQFSYRRAQICDCRAGTPETRHPCMFRGQSSEAPENTGFPL